MALNPLFQSGPLDPDGTPQVSPEATTLLLDDFSGTFANNWTTGGTAPTSSNGNATTNEGTTASATSYARTNEAFLLRAATYLRIAYIIALETTGNIANNTRWWGYGSHATTPSATAPITNGAVFLLDSANSGALEAVTYSGGTKTIVATLTKPSDGLQHRYEISYRQSVVYWVIDGVTVATKTFPNLAVATGLNGIFGAANTATAPSAHTFSVSSFSAGDQGGNNRTISDGVVPNRQATVKGASVTPGAADMALAVQAQQVPNLEATTTAATATAATLTLAAPGAGLRHYITSITMEQYCTATTTGSATPIVSTASNHQHVSTFPTALAIGTMNKDVRMFGNPVGATAQNTATSFTLPATTGIIWRITATYYVAP